ncbi:MAG TPA: NfeD family protein [Candidatus Nitrosotenuis sp.]|jgi:membrane protein implicated in regulation of membrane protease activity|nr:NfeD family protein [Candidatus Nitrosotenuis sp.]
MEAFRGFIEGLNLTLVFGGCLAAGVFYCFLAMLVGGDGGHGDGDVTGGGAFLSPTGLAIFAATFGATGLFFQFTVQASPVTSVLMALGVGVAVNVLVTTLLYKVFARSEAGAAIRGQDLVGMSAEVRTSIPEGGVGEVVYVLKGRQKAIARSDDGHPIPAGTQVRIERVMGSTVVVKRIES